MFKRKKYPVMWIVQGDEEIPIAWSNKNIPKLIDKLIKNIKKREKIKYKIKKIIYKYPIIL